MMVCEAMMLNVSYGRHFFLLESVWLFYKIIFQRKCGASILLLSDQVNNPKYPHIIPVHKRVLWYIYTVYLIVLGLPNVHCRDRI